MRLLQGFCVIFLSTIAANAQSPPETLWTKVLGTVNEELAYAVQQTADGGFVIAGLINYEGLAGTDALLLKTDREGESVWKRTYGTSGYEYGRAVLEYSRGGYVLVGAAPSSENTSFDAYLLKTDLDGEVQLERKYHHHRDAEARDVVETEAGGFLLVGAEIWVSIWGGGCKDFVVMTDSIGDTLWTRSSLGGAPYGLASTCTDARAVDNTQDGGAIITGRYQDSVYVMKIRSTGDLQWIRTLSGGVGTSVRTTMDGGLIVAGYGYQPERSNDVLLIKTDSEGNESWIRTFGTELDDRAYSLDLTNDGGFVLAGTTGNYRAADLYVVRINSDGDLLWTKVIGGPERDVGRSIKQTDDGGYIIAGWTHSFGAGSSDVWLVKLGQDLSVRNHRPILPERFLLLQPYPNPFNPTTTIEFSVPRSGLVTLTVYDLLGREVETILDHEMEVGRHEVQWNASNVSSGIYFIRMQASDPSRGLEPGFNQTRKVTVLQ